MNLQSNAQQLHLPNVVPSDRSSLKFRIWGPFIL